MIDFDDRALSCTTGGHAVSLGLDCFRPDEPCNENWIDWDEEVPIIGQIDAPESIPAGCCIYEDVFLWEGGVQATVRR